MSSSQQSSIKKAQKESQLLREIANLFQQLILDESRLREVFVNRVQLSPDKSRCSIFFYTQEGAEKFKELLPILILYKPSLRSALAHRIQARYTPDLVFRYDAQFEKQQHIENLLEKIKSEDEQS